MGKFGNPPPWPEKCPVCRNHPAKLGSYSCVKIRFGRHGGKSYYVECAHCGEMGRFVAQKLNVGYGVNEDRALRAWNKDIRTKK